MDETSEFLRIEEGEPIEAVFTGFKRVPDFYDPDKESVRYTFEVEVNGKKVQKTWETGSKYIALAFDKIPLGSTVKLSKFPEGTKPRYGIECVKEASNSKKK